MVRSGLRGGHVGGRLRLKCDGTRAETRLRLSAKRTSPFETAGASVQSTTGSRGVRINGSNAGYTMFRGGVKSTGYPLHSPVSPLLPPRASPCAITFQLDSTRESLNHRHFTGLRNAPSKRRECKKRRVGVLHRVAATRLPWVPSLRAEA